MDIPDIVFFADASINISLGEHSNHAHWFKNNWNDIQLPQTDNIDIV